MKRYSDLLWVGLGGFVGSNARFLVGAWAARRFGAEVPWGTFIINVSGSFILGLFSTLIAERVVAPPQLRLLVAIGFVGAYTTFSTFEYETWRLTETGSLARALANLVASVVAGFVAVWLGAKLARGV
jgi:CrcB protein